MTFANSKASRSQFGLRGLEGGAPAQGFQNLQGEAVRRQADNSKRTMVLTLAAMGAGAVGLYFIAGGSRGASNAPQVFTSADKCVAAQVHESGVCEAQWNEAAKVHALAAPVFTTAEACEKAHGKCMGTSGQQPVAREGKYMPVMSGYFFGTAAQGTFKGVPLYTTLADGPESYRVAEIPPKDPNEDSLKDKRTASGENSNGGGSRSLLFIPIPAMAATGGRAAPAAAPAAAAAVAPATAARVPAAGMAPAQSTAPAAANATTRGGLGGAARAASTGAGG